MVLKTKRLTLRLGEVELGVFRAVAEGSGSTLSEWVRDVLRREATGGQPSSRPAVLPPNERPFREMKVDPSVSQEPDDLEAALERSAKLAKAKSLLQTTEAKWEPGVKP